MKILAVTPNPYDHDEDREPKLLPTPTLKGGCLNFRDALDALTEIKSKAGDEAAQSVAERDLWKRALEKAATLKGPVGQVAQVALMSDDIEFRRC